jgi:hypothetical protein
MWGVPVDSLFYLAQQNVNELEVEIKEHKESETKKIYSFFSVDHSVSFIRDIRRNADFAIGEFGAFVAIPTTGSAFVVPIEDKSSIELLDKLRPMTRKFFDEDPGNLTSDIFWYHNDKFELLRMIDTEIQVPKELKERL